MSVIKRRISVILRNISNTLARSSKKLRNLYAIIHSKIIIMIQFFGKIKNNRIRIAKWLFEKLLGSFLISSFILYGSIVGFEMRQSPFQTVYFTVTILSTLAYILSIILIPAQKEKKVRREKKVQTEISAESKSNSETSPVRNNDSN